MGLDYLKRKGIVLPPIEKEGNLTARAILDRINDFYARLAVSQAESSDFAEGYFLQMLRDYPQSMCSQHITENMKLMIALWYYSDRMNDKPKAKGDWEGYSYEDLALIFARSKATIFQVLHEKEADARKILTEALVMQKAKNIALEELVREEKLKLEQNNQKSEQTNEQPQATPEGIEDDKPT